MRRFFISILFVSSLFGADIKLLDTDATDMAYQLELKKYPKFLCVAELEGGQKVQFASVKAMMQVFYHQNYFKKHKLLNSNIKQMYVQDYLDGAKIEVEKASYIFGSHIVGPHGDDLIPVKNETNAKLFKLKNGGTKILPFDKISKGLIRYLDM